jgi:glutathione S-transferase
MLVLYGFSRVNAKVRGLTRDLRVLWALEEMGLPFELRGMDHPAHDLSSDAYRAMNPFEQIPTLVDDGLVLTESAAILMYLAEKSGKLIPADEAGKSQVARWCFAALTTVEPTIGMIAMIDLSGKSDPATAEQRKAMVKIAHRWLTGLERWLDGREYVAAAEFTVADILMARVLDEVNDDELFAPYPNVRTYHERCKSRPAWQRVIDAYCDRVAPA